MFVNAERLDIETILIIGKNGEYVLLTQTKECLSCWKLRMLENKVDKSQIIYQ